MSDSKSVDLTRESVMPKARRRVFGKSWTAGPILSLFSYCTCTAFLIAIYTGAIASGLSILSFLGQTFSYFTIGAPIAMLLGSLAFWAWRPSGSPEHKMIAIAFNMGLFAIMTYLFIGVIDPYVIHPAANPFLHGQSGGHG